MNVPFDIFNIGPIIQNVNTTVQFLRGRNLLLQDFFCCGITCSKVMDVSLSDKQIFQCNNCKHRYSIHTGSFWSKSKLALNVLLAILFFFAEGLNVTECKKMMKSKVSIKTIIQWYNYYRDICTCYFANNHVMFTRDMTVHVDETAIGGKRKYSRGRIPDTKTRWLFGIINKNDHKAHVEFVEKRDILTIIPIITRHVEPGAVINSDGAKVYKSLDQMRYVHNTVIHKENFVNPTDGTHTNWIENFWSNLKYKLKLVKGSQKVMTDGHIDEFLYRYNHTHEGQVFELLLSDIANYYPI